MAKQPDQEMVLREDLNVGQLGLISIQRKIAPDYASWKVTFVRAGVPSEIECNGAQKYGVPHGIDNDSYLALQELYLEQGCPEDGQVTFTMYRLLQMCGVDDNGANRRMLRQSLERLSATQYWISGAWRNHEDDDWVTVGFRLIERLVFTRARKDVDGAKLIAVTLPRELTRNIRNGYFKPVSTILLRQLGQPARAAYRVLDALRHDPVQHKSRTGRLDISLMELAQSCGIASDKPDKIRRTLEPIHDDLLKTGYLVAVNITGRGRKQMVSYVFGTPSPEPDMKLVSLLTKFSISPPAARKAALEYPQNIVPAIKTVKAILERGYSPKNLAGFILDVVKYHGTGKYHEELEDVRPNTTSTERKDPIVIDHPADDEPMTEEEFKRTVVFLVSEKGKVGLSEEEAARLPLSVFQDAYEKALGRTAPERRLVLESLRAKLVDL